MSMHCDREWEIEALREGRLADKDAVSFERHVRTCEVCDRSRTRDLELRTLASSLKVAEPGGLELRRMRARILRDVELGPSRWSGLPFQLAIAVLISLCATTAFALHRRLQFPKARPLSAPAENTSAIGTAVSRAVRARASAPTAVPPHAADISVDDAMPSATPPATTHHASPTASSPAAITADRKISNEYASDVALFQARDFDAAAKAFAEFLSAHPAASQAEDASFLEASSLARAGRSDAAGLAAEHHLAAFPHSFHREDAAILVARAARDRGDCAQAREVLAPWIADDPEDEVVATLRSCSR